MAKHFPGFPDPRENWSKLPHIFIESLPLIKTLGEAKVILYILRHTWGFHDSEKRISLDEFARGRKRRGQKKRLDHGTGMSIPSIRKGIALALAHGFILVETDDRDRARIRKFYRLKETFTQTERNFQSGYKKLSPRLKVPFNRTKKETFERNPNGKKGPPSGRKGKPLFQGKFADLVKQKHNGDE